MVIHSSNPSTQEAEAGESQVQNHRGSQTEFEASLSFIARSYHRGLGSRTGGGGGVGAQQLKALAALLEGT
jgi:hypothetical protein